MLIPIGHEESTVRRLPWVTFTIMGICVVAFLLSLLAGSGEGLVAEREERALRYYFEHPYLTLAPQLKTYQFYNLGEQYRDEKQAPPEREQLASEQQELDRLTVAVTEAFDEMPFFKWGLIPARIQAHAIITHQFMHAGWMHLIGNLLILYLTGPFVEDVWGRPLFASFYLAGGAVAGLLFCAVHPRIDQPLIGASGAIAAVMGAFAVRYFNTKITFAYFFFFLVKIYHGTFQAPAWLMLGFWFARELLSALGVWPSASLGDAGDVAYLGHVGGFAFGALFALGMRSFRIEERHIHPAIEASLTVFQNTAVEQALDAARDGRPDEAIERLERRLAEEPQDHDAAAALWSVARGGTHAAHAAPALLPLLRRAARDGDVELVQAYWPELIRTVPDLPVDLALSVRCAELLRGASSLEDAADTVEWVAARLPASPPPALLVRLARLAHDLHLRCADLFVSRARQDATLGPAAAAELDRLLGQG